MSTSNIVFSPRKAAATAGVSLLLMALIAGFAYGYVISGLVVPGNASATADRIRQSEMLFRSGIFGFLLILVLDVFAAWGLHVFLRRFQPESSLLATVFRWLYAALLGGALFHCLTVLLLLKNPVTAQTDDQILVCMQSFADSWAFALILFGFHLLILGTIFLRTASIPTIIGVLLLIGGMCYVASNSAVILFPGYNDYRATVDLWLGIPMAVSEVWMAIWLVARGGKKG